MAVPLLLASLLSFGAFGAAGADAAFSASPPAAAGDARLAPFFADREGTFVVREAGRPETVRWNPARAARRFTPASTFKIPSAAIALETGVADGPDFRLEWDPVRDPRRPDWPEAWASAQTLQTAFRESCVWYFQELARRVGRERMSEWVRRFSYGNGEVTGPIDRFWLGGSLTISADEEVSFLERLRAGTAGLSPRTTAVVREIALLEAAESWSLYGKTGTMPLPSGLQLGWLVGWLESGGRTWAFSLNSEAPRAAAWSRAERVSKAKEMLRAVGLPPAQAAERVNPGTKDRMVNE